VEISPVLISDYSALKSLCDPARFADPIHRNHMGLERCIEVLTQDIRPRAKFNARLPGFVDLIKEDLLPGVYLAGTRFIPILLSYYLASRY
jgi:hypothetical protein